MKFIWGSVRFWTQSWWHCCKSRSLKRVICCQSEKESRPRLFRTLTPPKKTRKLQKSRLDWPKPDICPRTLCGGVFGNLDRNQLAKWLRVGGVAGRAHYQGAREGTAGEARTGRRLLTQLLPSKVSLHYIWTDFNSFKPNCLNFSIVRPIKLHWICFHRR